ncbi:MAG: nickel-dependent lactate racemase [Nitrospiraceae bacterium]|nr:nickel-dependent lactate racemase [Nitrospiraceae bacterium]
MNLEIPFGKIKLPLNIPDSYSLEVIVPKETKKISDPDTQIENALQNPIGKERLGNILKPNYKVSIIVSDATRPVPTTLLLKHLLKQIHASNVEKENIYIIFGLGIHRTQTEEEKINIVGEDIYQQYQCLDHNKEQCIDLGNTQRGTPVEIFQVVAESDFVICTGSIEHHYFAGYTGGLKAVLPGVSSRRSIEANHALMIEDGTAPGHPDCPVRADLEEAGNMVGVDFILNVVLNSKKEIVQAVAGHPVEAHRNGAETVDSLNKYSMEPADIVVVSPGGWPKDINLFQSHKALENVKSAVKPGGTIILVAQCPEGLGNAVYEEWLNTTSTPREAIEKLNKGFIQGGHKAALIGKMALEFKLYLVSEIPHDVARKSYFNPASSVQEAFDAAADLHGTNSRVVVVPYGGSTLIAGNKS